MVVDLHLEQDILLETFLNLKVEEPTVLLEQLCKPMVHALKPIRVVSDQVTQFLKLLLRRQYRLPRLQAVNIATEIAERVMIALVKKSKAAMLVIVTTRSISLVI